MTINTSEYADRRAELMAMMEENSVAVLPSAQRQMRNGDIHFPFRQDSDFHYLTGFDEPDAVVVLVPGREHGESILFCQEGENDAEKWHGAVAGPDRARQLFGVDDAFPISDIDEILPGLIEGRSRLYYAMGVHREFDQQVLTWVNQIANTAHSQPPGEIVQLGQFVHELRLYKSSAELSLIKRAVEITGEAHLAAMRKLSPGMFEYQLQAEIEYCFASRGARSSAYPSIVGGGKNACIYHYTSNSDPLQDGDLVLIDAGCEVDCYAADVTRTLPVNGHFSKAQQALYELVLAAQEAAIDVIKPGNHWNLPHLAAVDVIAQGLVDLGLVAEDVSECLETETYKRFFSHRTGHWLGLDVHDVGEYQIDGMWRVLEPGMVMTVEPGIYIAPDDPEVGECYRGTGIRIEDNVVVKKKGCEVLTADIPRTISDIEKEMQR